MPKVYEIAEHFETLVPPELKSEFDNVGLLVGIGKTPVAKAVVALDITDEVIEEAASLGAQMILSHHPLFFELKNISDDSVTGAMIVKLIQNGISAFCQHTNLDRVKGGVNDALARALKLEVIGSLDCGMTDGNGMGRIGSLHEPLSMADFLSFVKTALNTDGLRFYDSGNPVRHVAVCGGSGGGYVETADERGCDTIVTADIKHHEFLTAKALGLNIIDGGHYSTENVVVPVLADMLKKAFPEVEVHISKAACAPMKFYVD